MFEQSKSEGRYRTDCVKRRISRTALQNQNFEYTGEDQRLPLEDLEVGAEVEGIVTGVQHFGAFVDIGASIEGLLPNRGMQESTTSFLADATKVLNIGDVFKGRVRKVDLEKQKLELTCLQTDILPVRSKNLDKESMEEEIVVGTEVEGKVTHVFPYGAFVDIGRRQPSFLPRQQASGGPVEDLTTTLAPGRSVKGQVSDIDLEKERVDITCLDVPDSGGSDARVPLQELQIGDEVEGVIQRVLAESIMIDIGASENARVAFNAKSMKPRHIRLKAKELNDKFTAGDRCKGRIQTIDLERKQLEISIDVSSVEDKPDFFNTEAPFASPASTSEEKRTKANGKVYTAQEKRIDTDGNVYTAREFREYYGTGWRKFWEKAVIAPEEEEMLGFIVSILEVFVKADKDKNGVLDRSEFVELMSTPAMKQALAGKELFDIKDDAVNIDTDALVREDVFEKMDTNKDGVISPQEWTTAFQQGIVVPSPAVSSQAEGMKIPQTTRWENIDPIAKGTELFVEVEGPIFESTTSYDSIGVAAAGSKMIARGPLEDIDGYAMVPVQPQGAIELRIVKQGPAVSRVPDEKKEETAQ